MASAKVKSELQKQLNSFLNNSAESLRQCNKAFETAEILINDPGIQELIKRNGGNPNEIKAILNEAKKRVNQGAKKLESLAGKETNEVADMIYRDNATLRRKGIKVLKGLFCVYVQTSIDFNGRTLKASEKLFESPAVNALLRATIGANRVKAIKDLLEILQKVQDSSIRIEKALCGFLKGTLLEKPPEHKK